MELFWHAASVGSSLLSLALLAFGSYGLWIGGHGGYTGILPSICIFSQLGLINILLFLLLVNPSPFSFVTQLDICKEMASICARTSTKHALQLFDSCCMACCHFPYSSSARVGGHPYRSSGKEHNWFSCYNDGCCFSFIILLYNALVENTVAKLKYVICSFSWLFSIYFSRGLEIESMQ